jgi:hypothetical protein
LRLRLLADFQSIVNLDPEIPDGDSQAFDNVDAAAPELTQEDPGELESASALPPEYPGWMMARQAAGREPAARSACSW